MEFDIEKKEGEEKMANAITSLINSLKKVRTGRAQVDMLDGVKVNYYGSLTPLAQVASLSCPDAKSFLISPWEASALKEIEMAIVKSDLGLAPINDGKTIRLKLPDVTEQRRKELAKSVKKLIEDSKIGVRNIRRDINDRIKTALKDKSISEDDSKAHLDTIQKLTDKFIADIDVIGQKKEKDITSI